MELTAMATLETRAAFDGVAPGYAASNDRNPLLREMRARVMAAVFARVQPGAHIVDLGCGPGADDELLARAGYRVTAIDASPAMADEARRRVEAAAVADRVTVCAVGIEELDLLGATFDAALSNFGPLNCVVDLDDTARLIGARLKPGGVLIASVIGRVCPWEIALYLTRGDIERAFFRFRRGPVAVPLAGRTVWMRYHSPSEFATAFAGAGFETVSLEALGVVAPPPYLEHVALRHPRLTRWLQRADEAWGRRPILRGWGDHFLVVLRKR